MTGSTTKYKKKNGRVSWGYYFRTGKKPDGKRKQLTKQGFATKAEADAALRNAIADHEAQQRGLRGDWDHWSENIQRVLRHVDRKALHAQL